MSLLVVGIIASYKSTEKEDGTFKTACTMEDGTRIFGVKSDLGDAGVEAHVEVNPFVTEDGTLLLMAKGSGTGEATFADAEKNAEPQSAVDARRAAYAKRDAERSAAATPAVAAAIG